MCFGNTIYLLIYTGLAMAMVHLVAANVRRISAGGLTVIR